MSCRARRSHIARPIKKIIGHIQKDLKERFGENVKCLILYGSWAKGTAQSESDIDLLVIFKKIEKDTKKFVHEIIRNLDTDRSVTLLSAGINDFRKETLPIYTAVKREGEVIFGDMDMSVSPEPPKVKYADFFNRSKEFESEKVKTAEYLIEKDLASGAADLCFIAAKHAIQASLAMKGQGYSSKVSVLLPLSEKYLGKEIVISFKKLFELYIKSEYGIEFLTEDEARLAIEYAKKILSIGFQKL